MDPEVGVDGVEMGLVLYLLSFCCCCCWTGADWPRILFVVVAPVVVELKA